MFLYKVYKTQRQYDAGPHVKHIEPKYILIYLTFQQCIIMERIFCEKVMHFVP